MPQQAAARHQAAGTDQGRAASQGVAQILDRRRIGRAQAFTQCEQQALHVVPEVLAHVIDGEAVVHRDLQRTVKRPMERRSSAVSSPSSWAMASEP